MCLVLCVKWKWTKSEMHSNDLPIAGIFLLYTSLSLRLSSSWSMTIWPPTISLRPPRRPPIPRPIPLAGRPIRPRPSFLSFLLEDNGTGTQTLSVERRSRLLDRTVMFFGLKWPIHARSTRAWSPIKKLLFESHVFLLRHTLQCVPKMAIYKEFTHLENGNNVSMAWTFFY